MNRVPKQLSEVNESLRELSSAPGFSNCQKVIDSVVGMLGMSSSGKWKLFTDSQSKIKANATWFMMAEGFADRRAAYKVAEENDSDIDVKVYWMKNLSKSVVSWLTALTPNFEDEPFYSKKNIGIDFIIPDDADKVTVVLTKNYVIRTLELQDELKITQKEIFNKWLVDFDFSNKAQVHKTLWDSFDLEPVNRDFYKGISTRFVQLKQHLVDKGVYDDRHAAIFTNRLIGRIIFCWFLDKKGIVNPKMKYFDTEGVKATEHYHAKLETLFFRVFNTPKDERSGVKTTGSKQMFPETDPKNLFNANIDLETPFLNGGLFEERDDEKDKRFKLDFPADYFDDLYAFLRHYNFTTDESTSTFQQVAIDPEMLGRIFENLLAEQVEETGEQARKAKGAFYTPREIVDYMCKESLREYLKSKISETADRDQRLSLLLDKKAHEYRDQQTNYKRDLKPYKNDIIEALDNVKVIDPACGSGAFPMGMLQLLLQCYERLEPRFDPYRSKLAIIKNNLYGVDIEPMAVEISRLRAWLSIVVDESSDVKPLPNLDFKFVCANSLIPVPEDQDMALALDSFFSELESKIERYFLATDHETKDLLKAAITELVDTRVNEKLKHVARLGASHSDKKVSDYLKQKNKKALKLNVELMNLWNSYPNIFTSDEPVGFFDQKYFFPGVQGGFDILIANPPYIQLQRNEGKLADQFVNLDYETFARTGDVYTLFYERGWQLMKPKGILAYITSNKWMRAAYGAKTRRFLSEKTNPVILIDFSGVKIFDTVTVDTNILVFSKAHNSMHCLALHFGDDFKLGDDISGYVNRKAFHTNAFSTSDSWLISDPVSQRIREKTEKCGTPLRDWDVDISRGLLTGFNEAFIIDEETKDELIAADSKSAEIIKPILRGKDIKRYYTKFADLWLINTHNGYTNSQGQKVPPVDIEMFPAIKKHLDRFWSKLRKRQDKGITPYNLRNCAYLEGFEKEKVVWGNLALGSQFALAGAGVYINAPSPLINTNDHYLLAVLNSATADHYIRSLGVTRSGGYFEYKPMFVEKLPVPVISKEARQPFIDLVSEILSAKKKDLHADTRDLELQIDQLVYKLYDLTPEEIAVIEQSN